MTMKGNKFKYVILLLAVFIVLIMVGKANAQPYSQVNISDNITQTSNLYSYSTVQYSIRLYNTSASKFNISLPSNINNLTVLGGLKFRVYNSTDCRTPSPSISCVLVEVYNITTGIPINLKYEIKDSKKQDNYIITKSL